MILCLSFWPSKGVFATAMTYDEYLSDAISFCDNPEATWNQWVTRMVPKLTYPAYTSDAVNTWMEQQIQQESSPLGRQYLQEALNPQYIGDFNGIKTLEVAQIVYHARMNTLFDCAVMESRIGIMSALKATKALKSQSEIINKLNNEFAVLNTQYKQCLPDSSVTYSPEPTVFSRQINMRMVKTAWLQYCHYRKYLSYIESSINDDITNTLKTEQNIGSAQPQQLLQTSDELAGDLIQRQNQLSSEIMRADRSIPRAITAFQEMQRTYAAHLMLVIIYDDYVRLRDNLNRYMNPVSQLFEKAFNAMTPN